MAEPTKRQINLKLTIRLPQSTSRYLKDIKTWLRGAGNRRYTSAGVVFIILAAIVIPIVQESLTSQSYALSSREAALLSPTSTAMADKLKFDAKNGVYNFNADYTPANSAADKDFGGPHIKAQIHTDAKQGITVTDPLNKVDFTVKPKFDVLADARQQSNRLVYPLETSNGHLIYTAQSAGIKEDISLQNYAGNTLKFDYQLDLSDSMEARLLPSGAVGIYGSDLPINGNVTTGSDKDAQLLLKARQKAPKNKLLFAIPVPVIHESNRAKSVVKAKFSLVKDTLTVTATNLKQANYPMSIDPSIVVAAATDFFADANAETNVQFDTANNQIKRSALTGGNLGSWTGGNSLAAAHFLGAAAIYDSTLYVMGGASTTTTTNLAVGTNFIEQALIANDGTVGTFSNGNITNFGAGKSRFQLIAYNGYLYAIDGSKIDTTGASANLSSVIYYARIMPETAGFAGGAQLSSWLTATGPDARYDFGAVAYNGYLYMAGGRNDSTVAAGLTNVSYAPILPNGGIGSWTSTTSLPAARYGHDLKAYNGHLYIIGGNLNGTITNTVLYASVSSTGSIADAAWRSTSNFTTARENLGASFTFANSGYMYLTGGCNVVNATNQNCTTIQSDSQLAVINADGSLGQWFNNSGGSTQTRVGTASVGFNGQFYSLGGCSAMVAASVSCSTTSLTSNAATVNTTVGDVSAKQTPTAIPAGTYGQVSVVLNGFLYIIGGCATVSCNGNGAARHQTSYAAISSNGVLGSFTTDSTVADGLHSEGQFNGCDMTFDNCGLGGAGAAVYNGYIYVVGGYDGAAFNKNVFYQQPNASTGAIGAWTKSANTIATAVVGNGVFAHNGYIYSIGGCTGTSGLSCTVASGNFFTQVQRSLIGAAGAPGAFTATNAGTQMQLGTGIATFGLAFYGGYIYLAGGTDFANAQESIVQRAKLDANGNVVSVVTGLASGTWTNTTASMTKARRRTVAQGINGYLYIIGGHNAADLTGGANGTTYGDIQIGKMDLSPGGTGDISSFIASTQGTVTPRWNPAIAFANGFMYVTGGCTAGYPPGNCTTMGTTDESFVVYNADNFGANTWAGQTHTYSASSPDPAQANRLGASAVAYNGYLYVAGGCTTFVVSTLVCSAVTNTSAYAPIAADGTLGQWTAGPTITTAVGFGQLVVVSGNLYFIGGQTAGIATAVTTVYKSVIGANGVPGSFTTASQTALTAARTQFGAAVYNGRIYVVGGYSGAANQAGVYYSTIDGSGNITAWTSVTTGFTTARRELSAVVAGAYLYMIGGYDGTVYYSDVQVATPNASTGDISAWSSAREVPYKQAAMSAVAANGYLYVFGGRNGTASTSCSKQTYSASVNGNGLVSDWQQSANVLSSTARFGTAAGYYNGYMYVTGGDDCTNIISTAAEIVRSSGELSQAMNAVYSRYIDFGADATPQKFFILGTNAAISGNDIDRWKIIYKTSTAGNNAWGASTSSTISTFGYGNPVTFTPIDASSVVQGASQYWQITLDIDMTQSFGFPDNTQPTITKYDFYYSPGGAKRLRNGKTFTNETRSNLDAHP